MPKEKGENPGFSKQALNAIAGVPTGEKGREGDQTHRRGEGHMKKDAETEVMWQGAQEWQPAATRGRKRQRKKQILL